MFAVAASILSIADCIDRFSEDVDLAILKTEGQTETQIRILIRKVEKDLTMGLTELEMPGLTSNKKIIEKPAIIITE